MTDKRKVTDSLASLVIEGKPEPYRLGVPGGVIEFPDPADLDFVSGEKFLDDLISARSIEDIFKPWLSEEDWEKLKAAKPTLGQIRMLSRRLQEHYSYILGTEGEDSASGSI